MSFLEVLFVVLVSFYISRHFMKIKKVLKRFVYLNRKYGSNLEFKKIDESLNEGKIRDLYDWSNDGHEILIRALFIVISILLAVIVCF